MVRGTWQRARSARHPPTVAEAYAAAGFTLNILILLALTLAVGIVIDDAIVVLENIVRTVKEKGVPPLQAAVDATKEIGLAVLATTLSLVAVFLPVASMSGIVGRFLNSFGLTMAFSILRNQRLQPGALRDSLIALEEALIRLDRSRKQAASWSYRSYVMNQSGKRS
jgi:predicted exporter